MVVIRIMQAAVAIVYVLIGALITQPEIFPGIVVLGIICIFFNCATFNPGFTYTEGSNDIGEVIFGGLFCAAVPAAARWC